jgi:hypothetical protein
LLINLFYIIKEIIMRNDTIHQTQFNRSRSNQNHANVNSSNSNQVKSGKSNRGFASMDSERQREIASLGGKAAHAKGTAHKFTSEEARIAGRKGGLRSHSGNKSSGSNKQ